MALQIARAPQAAAPRLQALPTHTKQTKAGWVLVLASIASFMVGLDALVVTTALSTIRTELGASIEALEWTLNAYNLSFAMLLLTGTALGDYLGRRRMFAIGLGIFSIASAACALAPSVGVLIAARAIQGAGGALVMPLAMALLSAAYPPQDRARALGLYSGFTGLAILGGPVLGGAIVQGLDWHWIFWLNVPIGLVTIALTLGRIGESRGPSTSFDIVGLVLASGASLALVWGLVRANQAGWLSAEVDTTLGLGLALGVAFVWFERRSRAPMIPMRLFSSRGFSAGNVACFLFTADMYGTVFFVAQFLQTAQGYSPLQTGLRMLPWTATLFVIAPVAGQLVNRIGERPLIVIGLALQAVGLVWLRAIAAPDTAFAGLILPFVLAGTGISMAMPAAQSIVMRAVDRSEIGKASGIYNTLRSLGGAFGVALSATVFGATGGFGSPALFSTGFAAALGVSALLAVAAAVAGAFVPSRLAAGSSVRVARG